MNLISDFFASVIYRFLFNFRLNKIFKLYREAVLKDFDLVEPKRSYWIKCSEEYVGPPPIVDDDIEYSSPLKKQAKIIMKNWQYFPASAQKNLLGLIKYVAWLRKRYSNKKRNYMNQNKVSDHVYEM